MAFPEGPGRTKTPHVTLSVIFCVLFSAKVFTIIDLDNAQGRLITSTPAFLKRRCTI